MELIINIINISTLFSIICLLSIYIIFYGQKEYKLCENKKDTNIITKLLELKSTSSLDVFFIYIFYGIFVYILAYIGLFNYKNIDDINLYYTLVIVLILLILMIYSYIFSIEDSNIQKIDKWKVYR